MRHRPKVDEDAPARLIDGNRTAKKAAATSDSGGLQAVVRSTSECACARKRDMGTASAGAASNAAAFAARSSGVPLFDRRGFWEWARRLAAGLVQGQTELE